MANYIFIKVSILLACGHMLSGELYSSMEHINLYITGLKYNLEKMGNSLDITEEGICVSEDVQRFHMHLNETRAVIDEAAFTPHHPLDVYALFRQLSDAYTNSTLAKLGNVLQTANNESYTWIKRNLLLPYNEVEGVLRALLTIQAGYNLTALDIARGNIRGFFSKNKLTASDCKDLMALSFALVEHKDSLRPFEWLEVAQSMIADGDSSASSSTVYSIAVSILEQEKTCFHSEELYHTYLEKDPHDQLLQRYNSLINDDANNTEIDDTPELRASHDRLCQGLLPKDRHVAGLRPLSCFLVHNNHPLLLLSPVKMQQISYEPFIVEYYDLFTEKDISFLKEYATPMLRRSMVRAKTEESTAVPRRTSKSTGIWVGKTPLRMKMIVEALTGLASNPSNEAIQVANYGVGGRYYVHTDYFSKPNNRSGNRIATFMAYLSDVESGGATVFPYAGEAIFPEKGKAVFWYDLFRNGTDDERTSHAACPVVIGNKWVTTYWINTYGQEFTKPCSLNKDEPWY